MTDGNTTNDTPQGEAAKTAPTGDEAVLAELEADLDEQEAETGVGNDQTEGGQSEDDEVEDFELGGKAYKVPKALKLHLMRDADYTRSKQSLAEERKALEAERESHKASAKLDEELMRDTFRLHGMRERLSALQNLTPQQWAEIEQQAPQQATALTRELSLLKVQHDSLAGEIQQKQHQALEKQTAERSKLVQDSVARIAKRIPGWSDEKAGKLNEYAVNKGISLEELQELLPRKNADAYVEVLHNAFMYDQLMARTRAKASKTEAPQPVVIQNVSARRSSPATPMPQDSDDMATWVRKEQARLRKRASA